VIFLLAGISLVCVSLVIYFAGRAKILKDEARETKANLETANQRLNKVDGLLKNRKQSEGEAKNEKQELEDTSDGGLAGRADSLFP
jgi:hypothetical protein